MGESGIDGCFEPERSLEIVRKETIRGLQKFRDSTFYVNSGLQTVRWISNYISASLYKKRLQGRGGRSPKYVRKARDFSFKLNVTYRL